MKPIVDGLEQKDKGRLNVIRVNIQSTTDHTLAALYNFQYTPTFIFFDAHGRVLWRSIGQLDVNQVNNSLK